MKCARKESAMREKDKQISYERKYDGYLNYMKTKSWTTR